MPIIPGAPSDFKKCRLYELLLKKSSPEDGAGERAEVFLQSATPIVDLTIAGPFKEYTLHNRDHSKKLVHLIGQMVPARTLESLSVLECLLIIYSAFLHDMGLSVTSVERERILASDQFLDSLLQWPEVSDALDRARSRLEFATEKGRLQLETEIYQLQEAALSAYLRPLHASAERYRDLISRLRAASGRADLFHIRGVSFEEPLIDICCSHNLDPGSLAEVRGLYEERYPRDLTLGGEKANIQFCAALLRLADVLDFDRERTPRILFESLGISSRIVPGAEVSIQEWQKHMSVHTLEIDHEEIVVSADSHHPVVEKAVRDFCGVIEREIRDTLAVLRRNPSEIAATYLIELPISVRARIRSFGYVFKDMSLELNQAAISSLLMGERLYSHPAVALRELIQNSIDACGARLRLEGSPQYCPQIEVSMDTDETGRHWIRVTDNGVGMDEHVLAEYFLKLGNSYYESPEFRRLLPHAAEAKAAFTPISRFGVGLMSIFMIADVLQVDTKRFRSPRGDETARSVRIERLGTLAFVTDSSERGTFGTTIRIRVSPKIESVLSSFVLGACAYLREKIPYPRFEVSVDLAPLHLTLGGRARPNVRPDYRHRLSDGRLELVVLDVGRWSNRITGTAVLLLARNPDGKLSHTLDGEQLRFGTTGVEPSDVVSGYQGNSISVNGFRMGLKGINKILGTSKNRIAMLFDIDILGDAAVVYDVSRERIIGASGPAVREAFRSAILRGLEEIGVNDQLSDPTREVIRKVLLVAKQAATPSADDYERWKRMKFGRLDDELLNAVAESLPSEPWPQGMHKIVASKLGISNGIASRAINELLSSGRVTRPDAPNSDSPASAPEPLRGKPQGEPSRATVGEGREPIQ
jgi:molecular chaperone HtpG